MAERSGGIGLQITFALVALIAAVLYSGKAQFVLNRVNRIIHGKQGCAPVQDVGHVVLHYFGIRGRAEGIRFMLEDNGIPYAESTYTKEDWPAVKKKGIETGLFTFGQVPAITTTTGIQLVQSKAIMHHIGRSVGLDCDCSDIHTCEVLVYGTDDLRSKLGPVLYSPDFSPETRDAHINSTIHQWLPYFEQLAPAEKTDEEDGGLFFVGDRLTWVDYVMFDMLDTHVEFAKLNFGGKGQVQDILTAYPKLQAFYEQFSSRPKLAAYLKAKHRMPFKST